MIRKVKVLISGRVQGVGFRFWTKGRFNKLGLVGEVWNNEDGTVGVEFEGEEEKIKLMLEYLGEGPPLARVDKVAILK